MSKKDKRFCNIVKIIFIVCILSPALFFAFYTRNEYIEIYNEGKVMLENGNITEAVDKFHEIPNYIQYKDVAELLLEHDINMCPHCGAMLE